jgi:hypothetical protein
MLETRVYDDEKKTFQIIILKSLFFQNYIFRKRLILIFTICTSELLKIYHATPLSLVLVIIVCLDQRLLNQKIIFADWQPKRQKILHLKTEH